MAAKKAATNQTSDKVQLLVKRSMEDDCIIEIEPTWKVTFGYVNPAKSGDAYSRGEGHCLRIYEGEKLRLVLGNVVSFRDLSIPFAKKVEKDSGESSWTQDSAGNFEERKKIARESEIIIEEVDSPFGS